MKSVLEIMNQPLRAVHVKTGIHKIDNKIKQNTWETPTKESTSTKTADIVAAALLDMSFTTGILQIYIKQWLF